MTIYWTSEDCHGQAILTLHLPVGQVIIFPYFDHWTLNERSPKLTSFVRGTSNRCCCEERMRPVEHCLFSMSARYRGAVPLMHRNTCRSILNSMRRLIGSQSSCLRTSFHGGPHTHIHSLTLRQRGVNELAQDSKRRRWDSNSGPLDLETHAPRPTYISNVKLCLPSLRTAFAKTGSER